MKELEQLLQCPLTHTPLQSASQEELARWNQQVEAGTLLFLNGQHVTQPIQSAFKNTDGTLFYIADKDILCLLPYFAIALAPLEQLEPYREKILLNAQKQNVQDFYQQIGWQKGKDDLFEDTLQFEETRPVAKEYISRCHRRINRYLPTRGRYLLDVASGPLQFPEYLEYSQTYEKRICVDLSAEALKSAQKQLGNRGIYILGDITNLPLQNNTIDGIVSLHTIYHVPKDEQKDAFQQLHRILKPGGKALIVYTWGHHSQLMQGILFPAKVIRKGPKKLREFAQKLLKNISPQPNETESSQEQELVLYYHPHSCQWFERQNWSFTYRIEVWRSISLEFMQSYIFEAFGGRQLLRFIYSLEEKFPQWLGYYGQYPLIVISK